MCWKKRAKKVLPSNLAVTWYQWIPTECQLKFCYNGTWIPVSKKWKKNGERDNEFEFRVVLFGFIKNHFYNSLKFACVRERAGAISFFYVVFMQ